MWWPLHNEDGTPSTVATGGTEGRGGYIGGDVVMIDYRRKETLKEVETEMMTETDMATTGPLSLYH